MPWSMELRTRCTSGSPIFSSTVLSSSVVSPVTLQLDLLAEALAQVAHQAREAVEHEADGQHAHAHDAFLQRAHVALELRRARSAARSASRPSSGAASWLSTDCVITSSPTEFSSSSIFSMLTRIESAVAGCALRVRAPRQPATAARCRLPAPRGALGSSRHGCGDVGARHRRRRGSPANALRWSSSHSLSDPLEHRAHGGVIDCPVHLEVPAQAAFFGIEVGERRNATGIDATLRRSPSVASSRRMRSGSLP